MDFNLLTKYILFFLIIIPMVMAGQGEANNWYFGQNAGLSFNTSPPTVLLDGQLNTSEGCSTISLPNGDLLFYTDGRSIWSANHQLMPNADYFGGTGLNGDPSSTSSGLIVPHPSQDNLFYVFAVDEPHHENANAYPGQGPADINGNPIPAYTDNPADPAVPENDDGFNNGFTYTLVDMNLNGGLGDVVTTEKNIELLTYNPNNPDHLKYKCSEKITAVRADDCDAIWVITHFVDTFYAFKIDENGINTDPVESVVGPIVSTDDYRRAGRGYLKASPNGDKILTANQTMDFDPATNQDFNTGNVYLFDFDAATGILSNPIELFNETQRTYGVEFSPDGTKAYATVALLEQSDFIFLITTSILQWDLQSNDIPVSQYSFGEIINTLPSALQLAPDGKIYRPIFNSTTLAVINNPNASGADINYSQDLENGAISLNGRIAELGLPPFIQSIFSSRVDITGLETQQVDLCDGQSFDLFFGEQTSSNNIDYVWSRDGEIIPGENADTLNISQPDGVDLPYEETYTLEAELNDGSCPLIGVANVTYFPFPEPASGFLEECITNLENFSAQFNLLDAQIQLLPANTNLEDFNITYYPSIEDAENDQNPIENPEEFINSANPQTIGVAISTDRADCETIMEVTLSIVDFNVNNFTLSLCDDNQNGIRIFNLNDIEAQENLNIDNFYLTENEALNGLNPISNPSNFQNSNPYSQDVFFLIENESQCNNLGVLTLEVFELPVTQDSIDFYCVEQFPNPIVLSAEIPENEIDAFQYLWLPSEETTRDIQVNAEGLYEVAITRIETGCTNFRTIEVINSGLANFNLEIEEFFENNNTVTVIISEDSIGDYEFSLSPNGPYQDSNVFENLSAGIYDVYVRDKNGCGIVQKTFGVLGIMEFFTPNGDGINDVWTFNGLFNNREALAQVFIFDRYGKLLKSLTGLDKHWDGFFNGKPMPSQSYWYRIELESGRVLKGHFALIR